MRLAGFQIDGSLELQPDIFKRLDTKIDLAQYCDALRLWPEANALDAFRVRLREARHKSREPWLTFLGSGDFHFLTLVILEQLAQFEEPFHLVLVDHHPDWFRHSPKYHCGNWLSSAVKLETIKSVTLVAQAHDLEGWKFRSAPFEELCSGKVRIIPWGLSRVRVPLCWSKSGAPRRPPLGAFEESGWWGTKFSFESCQDLGLLQVFSKISDSLRGERVYLSVDKDCLRPQDSSTDWEQGKVPLEQLCAGLHELRSEVRLIGADIVGEKSPRALRGLLKCLDAGRAPWGQALERDPLIDRRNQQANLALLQALGLLAAEVAGQPPGDSSSEPVRRAP